MTSSLTSYDRVIQHLQRIATMTQESGHHPMQKRALLDLYFAADPSILHPQSHVMPALVGEQPGEWFFSDTVDPSRRILYVHGGSWMAGSSASHRGLISRIAAATDCLVLAINYRLAPEFPFPQGLEDVIQGFHWLTNPDHHPEHGLFLPNRSKTTEATQKTTVFLAGDSAGGNLVLSAALAMADSEETPKNTPLPPQPNAIIALCPAVDLSFEQLSSSRDIPDDPILHPHLLPLIAHNYIQENTTVDDPLVSPIHGQLHRLPPTLLQIGERDVLRNDCQRFYDKAHQENAAITFKMFPKMPHVFQGFAPLLPESNAAIDDIARFIASF